MVKGGGGTDTFVLAISGSDVAADTMTPTLQGVETLAVMNYENEAGQSLTIDLSLADSDLATVGTIASTNANADTTFSNIGKSVALTMAGKGDMTVTYAAGFNTGAADAATITLNGVGTSATVISALDISSVETLNVVSATAANYLSVADRAVTKINVSGSQNINIDVLDLDVTSFDASAATGVVTADLDAITLANLTTVKGGSGSSDVLQIDEAVTVTGSTAATNSLNAVSGFETVKVVGAAVAVALTTNGSGVVKWSFDDGAATVQQSLTLNAGYDQAVTVTIDDNDDVTNNANIALTINAKSDQLDATNTIAGGTGTDVINLTANAGTTALTNVSGIETITLLAGTTGVEDVTINVGAADNTVASTKTLTINAAALTDSGARLEFTGTGETNGYFNVTGGAGNDSIVGGDAADTLSGGAHNDTIDGAAGNDVISGDAGNDSITAGTGNDSLSGGAGNDTFVLAGNLDSNDTIDGGADTDTLSVTSIDATALTNVTNVENLAVTGAATVSLSANLSFTTIDVSDDTGAQAVTFNSGYTNATTVKLGSASTNNDSVVNTANVALTVDITDAGMLDSGVTITGGTGTDTLLITADAADTADFTAVTLVDAVTVRDGNTAGEDITIDLKAYATAISINASALNGTDEVLTITGGNVTKNMTITGGAGADQITAGSGNDVIDGGANNDVITAGSGNDNLSGGAGNDTFTLVGNLTYQDTINGGADTDTLSVDADQTDSDFLSVSSVEKLAVATGRTITMGAYAVAAGITTVQAAAAATISAAGYSGGLTVEAITAAGNVVVTGGSGNDVFVTDASDAYDANDGFTGGTGTDTLRINNDSDSDGVTGDAVAVTLDFASTDSVEQVVVNDIATDNAAGDITIAFAAAFDQSSLTIDASALDSGETLTITATNGTVANVDNDETLSIVGGSGADSLYGGAGNDTISGGAGNDLIHGGAYADRLTGGAGNDDFVFRVTSDGTTSLDSGGTRVDTITDFAAGSDNLRIQLTGSGTGLTYDFTDKGDVTSASDALTLLDSKVGQYVFNTTTAQLIMDSTGNGLLQGTDLVITMTGATGLAEADVDIYVTTSTGNNTVTTGAGNDSVTANNGNDSIVSGAGDDTIIGGGGSDTITAGTGNDSITISAAATIDGGSGSSDTLTLNTGDATIATGKIDGIEAIVLVGDGTDLTINGADLADNALTSVSGNTTGATVEYLKIGAAAGATNLDFSNITFTNAAVSITGSTGADTIKGGSAADVIASGNGADTITGGGAADSITGGGGVDIVKWTATTAATMATEAGTNAGGASNSGTGVGDAISTWTSGTDKLHFAAALVTNALGTEVDTLLEIAKGGTVTNIARFVQVTDTDNTDAVETHAGAVTILNGLTTTAVAVGDSFVVALDNDTNTYLYLVKLVSAANTIAAQDVTLIGVINGVTDVANGDFVSY